ncbi:unnamed protein product, partial [Heterotrigona itama]
KTPETSPTCANCKDAHPANYSKCPVLLAFLAKKTTSTVKTQHTQQLPHFTSKSSLPLIFLRQTTK